MTVREDLYSEAGARYYEAASAALRNRSGDIEFYRLLAREQAGPVLELGCGSGRILLPIAREGLPCLGLDSSEVMLGLLAARNPPPNLRTVVSTMESFDLPGQSFGLIFSAFRAFQHLLTVDEQLACLERVRRHLAPGGCFALDVFAPKLERVAVAEEPETEDARFTLDGDEVVRFTSVRRDLARQRMEVLFRHERRPPEGPPQSEIVATRMRYLFRYELEHLLARAGFTDIRVFGGFDRRPYDYFSGETVVTARAERR